MFYNFTTMNTIISMLEEWRVIFNDTRWTTWYHKLRQR